MAELTMFLLTLQVFLLVRSTIYGRYIRKRCDELEPYALILALLDEPWQHLYDSMQESFIKFVGRLLDLTKWTYRDYFPIPVAEIDKILSLVDERKIKIDEHELEKLKRIRRLVS